MQQCPLFGRRPLLGVSVNRESTVYSNAIKNCDPIGLDAMIKLTRQVSIKYYE